MNRCGSGQQTRTSSRPRPQDWGDDELLTLAEAVQLYWPDGPLTVRSLRTAIRDGQLPIVCIAGKHLVTKRAILAMCQCAILSPQPSTPDGAGGTSKADFD